MPHVPAMITDTTESVSVGPVILDIRHARENGWPRAVIEQLWRKLAEASREAYVSAHAGGPLSLCKCVACDPRIQRDQLPSEYRHMRDRWNLAELPDSAFAVTQRRK
jgi:hypothetical protein